MQVGSVYDLSQAIRQSPGAWRISIANDHLEEEFPAICTVAYTLGNCVLLVDETDMFCSPNYIPPAFKTLVSYGRHNRAHYIVIARRPSEIHRLPTSQAWELCTFQTQEPRDIQYLAGFAGRPYAAGLPTLPLETYRFQNVRDRREPFIDLKIPPIGSKKR